jgi:hypothetical protein
MMILTEIHSAGGWPARAAAAPRRKGEGMSATMQSDAKSRVISGTKFLISNGQYFDFLDPASSEWGALELAIALGKCCRFAGHCKGFYSVAEHSVYVANLVPAEHRLAALLHDAHEAFTGDITYPLKQLIGELIKPIEARIDAVLFSRFGVSLPLPDTIKRADRIMLWHEQRMIMGNSDKWAGAEPPEDAVLSFLPQHMGWPPNRACFEWLRQVQIEMNKGDEVQA